tara:strand:+ start:2210 stop:2803 length:594 start_codon:yes stop_codon:yes gene_type:complete
MLWYGSIFLFVAGTMLSMMVEGGSGIASSQLTSNITATDQFIPVQSTSGFLDSDTRLFVGDEQISYTSLNTAPGTCGSFTPPCFDTGASGRGTNSSTASAHTIGTHAYSEAVGLLNEMVGYRVGDLSTLTGKIFFPINATATFTQTISKAVMWDYSFLEGGGFYFKVLFLYPLSVVMVMGMVRMFANMIGFLLGRGS